MPPRKKADPLADRMASGWYSRTEDETEGQQDGEPAEQDVVKPASQQVDELTNQQPVRMVKRTYYLPENAVLALEQTQLADRIRTGRRPDLSDLVTEAVWLLVEGRKQDGKPS